MKIIIFKYFFFAILSFENMMIMSYEFIKYQEDKLQ